MGEADRVTPNMMTEPTSEHDLVLQALRAAGADAGAVWILAAETTGERELDFLLTRGVSRSEVRNNFDRYMEQRWEQVIVPNAQDAEAAATHARSTWPQLLVLNLAGLDVVRWRRDPELKDHVRALHKLLKDMVFDAFVHIVVAGPQWAYAEGERARVNLALQRALPICDVDGRALGVDDLRSAAAAADDDVRTRLGSHPVLRDTIDEVLTGVEIAP
jgi:hypothetical protein